MPTTVSYKNTTFSYHDHKVFRALPEYGDGLRQYEGWYKTDWPVKWSNEGYGSDSGKLRNILKKDIISKYFDTSIYGNLANNEWLMMKESEYEITGEGPLPLFSTPLSTSSGDDRSIIKPRWNNIWFSPENIEQIVPYPEDNSANNFFKSNEPGIPRNIDINIKSLDFTKYQIVGLAIGFPDAYKQVARKIDHFNLEWYHGDIRNSKWFQRANSDDDHKFPAYDPSKTKFDRPATTSVTTDQAPPAPTSSAIMDDGSCYLIIQFKHPVRSKDTTSATLRGVTTPFLRYRSNQYTVVATFIPLIQSIVVSADPGPVEPPPPSATGDPYVTTLSGITYKMADFTGYSRMIQGTLENKPFFINTETTLLTKEELKELISVRNDLLNNEITKNESFDSFPAYFSKLHVSWGKEKTTIDLKSFKIIESTKNDKIKTIQTTGKEYEWDTTEVEQTNMLIPFGPVTLVVKNIPNIDIRNGFTLLGSNHIKNKVGALVKPMYVKDIKIKSLTSTKLIKQQFYNDLGKKEVIKLPIY